MGKHRLACVAACALLTGCAQLNSIYRSHDFETQGSAVVDVKQRMIVVGHLPQKNEIWDRKTVACAEPSPDALSAYAAELAASSSYGPGQSADLASAFQESSSYIGLRTQSIQLLRDAAYRVCEGYLNGAFSAAQYDILMRRHQKIMVSLLAIEQLTGVVKVPVVSVDASSFAAAGAVRREAEKKLAEIDGKIVTTSKARAAALTANTNANVASFDADLTKLKADRATAEKELQTAGGAIASGTLTIKVEADQAARSDAHIQKVAEAVQTIVDNIVTKSQDVKELCVISLLSASVLEEQDKKLLRELCQAELTGELARAKADLITKTAELADALKTADKKNADLLKAQLLVAKLEGERKTLIELNASGKAVEKVEAALVSARDAAESKKTELNDASQEVTNITNEVSNKADALTSAATSAAKAPN